MRLTVKVVPNAKQTEGTGNFAGVWRIRLAAPPRENRANDELVRWLAEKFNLAKSVVVICRGKKSSIKIISLPGEWTDIELEKIIGPKSSKNSNNFPG